MTLSLHKKWIKTVSTTFAWVLPILVFSGPAHAEWSDAAHKLADQFVSVFEDTYVATSWGAVHMQLQLPSTSAKIEEKQISTPGYELPFHFKQALLRKCGKKKCGRVVKAPLMIFLPGMFSDIKSYRTDRFIDLFTDRGYHVVLLPNTWSPDAIAQRPRMLPGDIQPEATAMQQAATRIIANIHADFGDVISSVNLSGESYGTILSSVFLDTDRRSTNSIITGSTTLISPIMQMNDTLDTLDESMDRVLPEFEKWNFSDVVQNFFGYLTAKTQTDLSAAQVHAGEIFFSFEGFNPNLVKTINAMEDTFHFGKVPVFKNDDEKKAWTDHTRFKATYFNQYAPGLAAKYQGEKGSLAYWLGGSGWLTNGKLRVLFSLDDFVNAKNPNDARNTFRPADQIALPHGGHSGFLSYPWFDQFAPVALGVTGSSAE
jgi:hypothetical protein